MVNYNYKVTKRVQTKLCVITFSPGCEAGVLFFRQNFFCALSYRRFYCNILNRRVSTLFAKYISVGQSSRLTPHTKKRDVFHHALFLFPLYRCGRFAGYIVYHAVDVFYFVDYSRRSFNQHVARNIRPVRRHSVDARYRP